MARIDDFTSFVFVVGAPRCGTTTLSRFLKDHPSVCFPAIKEPHFFSRNDLSGLSADALRRRVDRDYLGRFFRPDPSRPIGVEGSVTYLYTPELLEPILDIWPSSKFVVALRDPLTMLPSLHRRLVYVGQESIRTFAEAWSAIPSRIEGRRTPSSCWDSRLLRYDQAACFGTYVERLFKIVGKERCHVVIFNDLVRDPGEEYRRLMDFCGLEPQANVDLSPKRQGQSVRLPWLQKLLKQGPRVLTAKTADELFNEYLRKRSGRPLHRATGMVFALRKHLLRWNRVATKPESLSPALEREICVRFQKEIERLEELLDRDFSQWLQPGIEAEAVQRGELLPLNAVRRYGRAFSH